MHNTLSGGFTHLGLLTVRPEFDLDRVLLWRTDVDDEPHGFATLACTRFWSSLIGQSLGG